MLEVVNIGGNRIKISNQGLHSPRAVFVRHQSSTDSCLTARNPIDTERDWHRADLGGNMKPQTRFPRDGARDGLKAIE